MTDDSFAAAARRARRGSGPPATGAGGEQARANEVTDATLATVRSAMGMLL
ncbi:hypothetical protein [Calidifontibacter terrae]